MVNVKILGGVAVLVVAAAAAMMTEKKGTYKTSSDLIGEPLMDTAITTKLTKLEFIKGEKSVQMEKDAKGEWLISSDNNFPAHALKVMDWVTSAADNKLVRVATTNPDQYPEFEVEGSNKVLLHGEGGYKKEIVVGKIRERGGTYIRLPPDESVYLSSGTFIHEADASTWEYNTLVGLKEEQVKAVKLWAGSEKEVDFSRQDAEGDMQLTEKKDDEKLKENAIKALPALVRNLDFINRGEPQSDFSSKLADAAEAQITTFEGHTYKIKVVEISTTSKNDKGEEEASSKFYVHVVADDPKASRLGNLMSKWQFEISQYTANQLRRTRSDFLMDDRS